MTRFPFLFVFSLNILQANVGGVMPEEMGKAFNLKSNPLELNPAELGP